MTSLLSSKKGMEPIAVVAAITLVLLVLYIILNPTLEQAENFRELTACEFRGGTPIEEDCNPQFARELTSSSTDNSNCCVKKTTVSEANYEEWLNGTTKVEKTENKDSNEIPVVRSRTGRTDNIALGDIPVPQGQAILYLNGKEYTPSLGPLQVPLDGELTILATHNHEDGEYCHLYVAEAEASGTAWQAKRVNGGITPLGGMSVKLGDCQPEDGELKQVQIVDTINKAGMYKADFIVRESETGSTLASRTLVFNITSSLQVPESPIPPTISFPVTTDSRGTDLYCWGHLTINTHGQDLGPVKITADLVDGTCGQAIYEPYTQSAPLAIRDEQQLCVQITQPYINARGDNVSFVLEEQFRGDDCDFAQIITGTQETTCVQSCGDYQGSEIDKCNAFDTRTSACEYGPDCYQQGNSCETCNIETCRDYGRNRDACEANQCTQRRCVWEETRILGINFGGNCIPYTGEEN